MGTTKNDDGRVIVLDGELLEAIQGQWETAQGGGDTRTVAYPALPLCVPSTGRPIRDFAMAWAKARSAGKSNHGKDSFTTSGEQAVRDMVRAGIAERVAMMDIRPQNQKRI